jgi:hypothetical protein
MVHSALAARVSGPIETMRETGLKICQKAKVALQLVETVDETLEMLFGRKAKLQIYSHLEKEFGLRRSEILDNPESFSMGLSNLFGSASKQIELNIARKLNKKLDLVSEPDQNLTFAEYIIELSGIDRS